MSAFIQQKQSRSQSSLKKRKKKEKSFSLIANVTSAVTQWHSRPPRLFSHGVISSLASVDQSYHFLSRSPGRGPTWPATCLCTPPPHAPGLIFHASGCATVSTCRQVLKTQQPFSLPEEKSLFERNSQREANGLFMANEVLMWPKADSTTVFLENQILVFAAP